MKLIISLFLGLIYSCALGQSGIPECRIQDERLLKVLTAFADTVNLLHNNKWIMHIYFDKSITKIVHPSKEIIGGTEIDLTQKSLNIDLEFFVFVQSNISSVPTTYT